MFQYFCDLVFGVPIREIEVILWNLAKPRFDEEFMKPSQTFLPLTILRNVGNLTIREAALDEFLPRRSSMFTQAERKLLFTYPEKSNLLDKKSYKKLKRLVEGNRPVERLSEMHTHLISFVLSFENLAPWKLDLRNLGEEIQAIAHTWNTSRRRRDKYYHVNPYGVFHRNFLEKRIRRASKASQSFDSMSFKSTRADIVEHLQTQYNRIVDASRVLLATIKEDKFWLGAPNRKPPVAYFKGPEAAKLVILIEKYAAAFERDQDEMTKIGFRTFKREIKNLRMDHPRAMVLQKLGRSLEHKNTKSFIYAFKDLLYDLETQSSEIKQGWRDLFKSDTHGNTMCHIDYERIEYDSGSLDGMINLTAREPTVWCTCGQVTNWN
ncbi:hypothetical protein BOTCAL_0070g00160 [Botryotinia calthae]|uniref:Uncharacterized protein n=1 Tax=Botryotinia calthae TaxID=38488 RepID=A0A4Y8D8X3_9HELO|nr:hypothetical protein BOTCAL_0070g00160 [Botryotinia calthae]